MEDDNAGVADPLKLDTVQHKMGGVVSSHHVDNSVW